MVDAPKKSGRIRQMRVVPIRPRGTPRDDPPPMPVRASGTELSAFPEVPVPFCPRELIIQVSEERGRLGHYSGVRALTIYGGDSMWRQLDGLRRGAHVVVGTPGRVRDHLRQGTLKLDAVRFLVLDEADRMRDMGFEKEVRQILDQVPKDRQTLMFSATIPSAIEAMASRYQREPERLMLSQDALYVEDVQHLFCILSRMDKTGAL